MQFFPGPSYENPHILCVEMIIIAILDNIHYRDPVNLMSYLFVNCDILRLYWEKVSYLWNYCAELNSTVQLNQVKLRMKLYEAINFSNGNLN